MSPRGSPQQSNILARPWAVVLRSVILRSTVLVLLASLMAGPAVAQSSDAPTVSLMIAPPGDESVYAWFGHSSLVVHNDSLGLPRAYTYSVFKSDSQGKAFFDAATGSGLMDMEVVNASVLVDYYAGQGRTVRYTELDLTDAQARDLESRLQRLAADEGVLDYDIIEQNCSTRIRDVIDEVLGGAFRDATSDGSGRSIRQTVRGVFGEHIPLAAPLISFLYGSAGDRELTHWETMFLPWELEAQVHTAAIARDDGGVRPLATEAVTVLPGDGTDAYHFNHVWTLMAILVVALGAQWMVLRRDADASVRPLAAVLTLFGVIAVVLSLVMVVGWTGLLGPHLARNVLVILVAPFAWLLVPIGIALWRGDPEAWVRLQPVALGSLVLVAMAAVVQLGVQWFFMDNLAVLLFAVILWGGLYALTWTQPVPRFTLPGRR